MVDPEDHADALERASRAKALGAHMVEYRIDQLFQGEDDDAGVAASIDLAARSPLPCIITCRPTWEGGAYDGEDTDRIALFESLGTADVPPAYIDVELEAYTRSANLKQKVNLAVQHPGQVRSIKTRLVLSTHDFASRPADLTRKRASMAGETAAAVHKIAFHARSVRDTLECFEILRDAPVPTIAIAMGEAGIMSRVLAPKFNAFLTFVALDASESTAPGQPTISEMTDLYRFNTISRSTRVYGVIGDPVSHSRSPSIHNSIMGAIAVDGVYLPLLVHGASDPDDSYLSFRVTVGQLLDDAALDFTGASITIPHKVNALRFAREDVNRAWQIDQLAELAGAVNTFAIGHDQTARAFNTDASAIKKLLAQHVDSRTPGDTEIAIVGAGGVARGAAAAAVELGYAVRILARRSAQAQALVDAIQSVMPGAALSAGAFEERLSVDQPIAIQCTPIGMESGSAPLEVALRFAPAVSDPVLLETVYTPVRTPTVAAAEAAGATVITGDVMFIEQAIEQARIWHGDLVEMQDVHAIACAALGQ